MQSQPSRPCLMFLALFMTRSRVSWPNQPIPCQKQNDTRNALDQKFVRSQLDPTWLLFKYTCYSTQGQHPMDPANMAACSCRALTSFRFNFFKPAARRPTWPYNETPVELIDSWWLMPWWTAPERASKHQGENTTATKTMMEKTMALTGLHMPEI